MNTVEISERLAQTTYVIEAFDRTERYSIGSGVAINHEGLLITAAHVVTGRLPIRDSDWRDPNLRILGRTKHGPEIEYRPILCGITVEFPNVLREGLIIDLALLIPKMKLVGVPFLPVALRPFPVGTQVLMAGYPDELELPLLFDRAINFEFEPTRARADEIKRDLEKTRQLLMIKSGMIGHVNDAIFHPDASNPWQLEVFIYYIDNAMHSGSSGGPVVNDMGEIIGIVTKRAVTEVSYPDLENPRKEVPSGSALAVSAHTLLKFVDRQIATGNIEQDPSAKSPNT